MNSKEALERLGAEKLARGELIRNDNKVEPYIKCIEQDLDRLEKLKKVIESLKDNIYFTFNDECTYICLKRDEYDECDYTIIYPNKEQYELLKEVLGNKWYNKPLPAFAPEENYNYSFVNDCFQKAENMIVNTQEIIECENCGKKYQIYWSID